MQTVNPALWNAAHQAALRNLRAKEAFVPAGDPALAAQGQQGAPQDPSQAGGQPSGQMPPDPSQIAAQGQPDPSQGAQDPSAAAGAGVTPDMVRQMIREEAAKAGAGGTAGAGAGAGGKPAKKTKFDEDELLIAQAHKIAIHVAAASQMQLPPGLGQARTVATVMARIADAMGAQVPASDLLAAVPEEQDPNAMAAQGAAPAAGAAAPAGAIQGIQPLQGIQPAGTPADPRAAAKTAADWISALFGQDIDPGILKQAMEEMQLNAEAIGRTTGPQPPFI